MPHARLVDVLRAALQRVRDIGTPPERLYALLDAVVGVTTDLDLRSMLQRIVNAGCRLTDASYGVLAVHDEGRPVYRQCIAEGLPAHQADMVSTLSSRAELMTLLLNIDDGTADPGARPGGRARPLRGLHAVGGPAGQNPGPRRDDELWDGLAVPIQTHDSVFAELFVGGKDDGSPFTAADKQVLETLAAAAAVAMGNARMVADSAQRQRWLEAAAEITDLLLAEEMDSHHALQVVVRRARELLRADVALLCLRQETSDDLRIEVADGLGADNLAGKEIPQRSLAGAVMRDGRRAIMHEADSDPRAFRPPADWAVPELGGGIVVPLTSGTRMYGVLEVFAVSDSALQFHDTDAALAEAFAGQAAIALDRLRAGRERQLLAIFEERDRIARDLHDVVIQRLFGAGLKLQSAARMTLRPGVTERVEGVVDELDETIQDIRRMIFHLHTAHNNRDIRTRAAAVVAESASLLGLTPKLVVEAPVEVELPEDAAADVLAVLREALSSCVRRAGAQQVEIHLCVGEEVSLSVDGNIETGGLRSMRERAQRRGGDFSVETKGQGSTVVHWHIPVAGADEAPACPLTTHDRGAHEGTLDAILPTRTA